MNFKEALDHEARAVFCNPAEFGEAVILDDIPTNAVISNIAASITDTMMDNPYAVRPRRKLSFCKADFPDNFPEGRTVTLNGVNYYVEDKQSSGPMTVLVLQQEV